MPKNILRLPFLWVNGRSDGTVSIDGANVYPSQIDIALHSSKELLAKTSSFKMKIEQKKRKNFRFSVLIELKNGVKGGKNLARMYHTIILKNLLSLNRDYKASYIGNKKSADPRIVLHDYNCGPFKRISEQIKNKYIV